MKWSFLFILITISITIISYYIKKNYIDFEINKEIIIENSKINLKRNENGVITIFGNEINDFARGLGYLHAIDRPAQLIFQRIVGQGRLSELVTSNKETLLIGIL
jgi:acyl-homoserine lactone acylase PvdQ